MFFMLYCAFILPESLPERRQEIARKKAVGGKWWETFDPRGLLKPLRIFYPTGPGSSRELRVNMMLLAIIDCTLFGVGMSAMSVIIMYAEKEFGWKNLEVSASLCRWLRWLMRGTVFDIPFCGQFGTCDGAVLDPPDGDFVHPPRGDDGPYESWFGHAGYQVGLPFQDTTAMRAGN